METSEPDTALVREAQEFIREHRADCLWFLRDDLVPSDRSQILRLLEKIERRADRATFIEARRLRKCLSPTTSAGSVGS